MVSGSVWHEIPLFSCALSVQAAKTEVVPAFRSVAARAPHPKLPDGNFAFTVLKDANPDCKGSVDKWKNAFSNFNQLPPVFVSNDEPGLYANVMNYSFVAVYNPGANPTADCRVVTCTQTKTVGTKEVPQENQTTKELKKGYGLICLTTPKALVDGKAPFT